MTINLLHPPGLVNVDLYAQTAVATGSKLVFVAGQVAWDVNGVLVGEGDLVAQVEQCYLNIAAALAEAGASFDHVAKLTVYVVDWTADKMPLFTEGVARAADKLGPLPAPPLTGIGVAALADPGVLVEVEALAVID
ncbi:RidA family protein [Streptomyces sp. NPDC048018]|uniref:RidA family protein n=1 Tax=Streptomyces sp. NPDC048018 TaxID=3365499 RepID=UPI00371CB95B